MLLPYIEIQREDARIVNAARDLRVCIDPVPTVEGVRRESARYALRTSRSTLHWVLREVQQLDGLRVPGVAFTRWPDAV